MLKALALSLMLLLTRTQPVPPPIPHITFAARVDAKSVAQAIRFLEQANADNPQAIVLEISSPGGEVDAGFLLMKAVERSHAPVVCVVDGEAASMAFAILQSCSRRAMTTRSSLLAHQISVSVQNFGGNEKDWRNVAEMLRVAGEALDRHCAHRLHVNFEEYRAKIADGKDWWMTPAEALAVGAVDQVVGTVDEVQP
jgi:ATP-dependent protease ClpP protease subunit